LVGRRRVRRLAAGMAAVLALTVVIVADVNGFTPASAAGSAPTAALSGAGRLVRTSVATRPK